MAHVGEEFAFGAAGGLGSLFGLQELDIGLDQFLGAGRHGVFQLIAMSQQGFIPALDFRQHLVEGVGQLPQVIVGLFNCSRAIILVSGD
jgi:hypothetical protein